MIDSQSLNGRVVTFANFGTGTVIDLSGGKYNLYTLLYVVILTVAKRPDQPSRRDPLHWVPGPSQRESTVEARQVEG
jgi:hypothetical protein